MGYVRSTRMRNGVDCGERWRVSGRLCSFEWMETPAEEAGLAAGIGEGSPGLNRAGNRRGMQPELKTTQFGGVKDPKLEMEEDAVPGVVTLEVMRKVLGQSSQLDRGSVERRLREWLKKEPKGYIEAIDARERESSGAAEREAELECLRAEVAELRARESASAEDGGTERVRKLILECLRGG